MKSYEIIDLPSFIDERGSMTVAEADQALPFTPQRLFFIYDTPANQKRGEHANTKTEFILIAAKGSITVDVDDGHQKDTFILDDPTKGLYLSASTWKIMRDFSPGSVLLVIANTKYDKNEYITSYEDFLKEVRK